MARVMDMNTCDAIEGMLMSQLVIVNELHSICPRLASLNNAEYFAASTRYLQLADKATPPLAILTGRLDQHRGQGSRQIVVKHVTVNADQAVVTDTIVTGQPARNTTPSPALLADATETAMPMLDETSSLNRGGCEKR